MKRAFTLMTVFILLLPGLPAPVQAETGTTPQAEALDGAALSDDVLGGERGKAFTPTNTNELDGLVHDNVARDLVTGYNMVSDGSLTNNAGFNTVIQNSGNNVLIQNALILNIQVQ